MIAAGGRSGSCLLHHTERPIDAHDDGASATERLVVAAGSTTHVQYQQAGLELQAADNFLPQLTRTLTMEPMRFGPDAQLL